MQFQWAMHNYYSIIMRTITLHTIHAGAQEHYTKSNNITKLLTELSWAVEVMERTNVTIIFATIRTSKSAYYLLYCESHSQTQYNYNSIFNLLQIFASPTKK